MIIQKTKKHIHLRFYKLNSVKTLFFVFLYIKNGVLLNRGEMMKRVYKLMFFSICMVLFFTIFEKEALANQNFTINNNSNIAAPGAVQEDFIGIQFTRTRLLEIRLQGIDVSNYQAIRICEFADDTPGSVISQTCQSDYAFPSPVFNYQIVTLEQTGEDAIKNIGIELQLEGGSTWEFLGMREIILKTTGPALSLIGNDSVLVARGSSYVEPEPAYAVSDPFSLFIEVSVSGLDFSTDEYGKTHFIVYEAVDFLGNRSTVQRRIVVEERDGLGINMRIVAGMIMGTLFLSALVYVNFWNKKQKEKNKSLLERKRPDVLK